MGELIQIGKTTEIKDGTMKEFTVRGREILLANIGGRYYATQNRCPHLGGRLSQGKFHGAIVTCPRHGSQFDVSNGQVVRWLKGSGLFSKVSKVLKSPRQLTTYKVSIDGDNVMVEM